MVRWREIVIPDSATYIQKCGWRGKLSVPDVGRFRCVYDVLTLQKFRRARAPLGEEKALTPPHPHPTRLAPNMLA